MNKYNIIILFKVLFSVSVITAAVGGGNAVDISDSDEESCFQRVAKMSFGSSRKSHPTVVRHVDDVDKLPMDLIGEAMISFSNLFIMHLEDVNDFIQELSQEGLIPKAPKDFDFGNGDFSDDSDHDGSDDEYENAITPENKDFLLSIDWQTLVDRLRKADEQQLMNIFMDALEYQGLIKEKNELEVIRFLKSKDWGYICGGCLQSQSKLHGPFCCKGMIAKPGCSKKVFSPRHAWEFVGPHLVPELFKKHRDNAKNLLESIK